KVSYSLGTLYVLFPADASKFLYVHGYHLHLSSILFWLGAILYARGRQIYAAIAIASTILVYETHLAQAMLMPLVVNILRKDTGGPSETLRGMLPFYGVFALIATFLLLGRVTFAPGRLPVERLDDLYLGFERLFISGWLGIRAIGDSLIDRAAWLGNYNSF